MAKNANLLYNTSGYLKEYQQLKQYVDTLSTKDEKIAYLNILLVRNTKQGYWISGLFAILTTVVFHFKYDLFDQLFIYSIFVFLLICTCYCLWSTYVGNKTRKLKRLMIEQIKKSIV